MVPILCLYACTLVTGQPGGASEWLLLPSLGRGQELVYRGTFDQEALGAGVQFRRRYRVENRVFVLDASPKGAEVALFTTYKLAGYNLESGAAAHALSARLELGRVDFQGKVTALGGAPFTVPGEGPPLVETGAFVPAPRGRVHPEQTWEVADEGLPPRTWQVLGQQVINGTACLKLSGVQQSEDWDQPRADRASWRRCDTVWMIPRLGIACKVERTIEQREPLRQHPGQRCVMRYELETSPLYPGQLVSDRRGEILQARAFTESAEPCLREPTKHGVQIDSLLLKIGTYLDRSPGTPYREAIMHLRQRLEAARRGELPPPEAPERATTLVTVAALNQPAPDFVVPDLTKKESARLRHYQGRPVVMVFYSPASLTVEEVLHFAQRLADDHRSQVTVLGLAMSDDGARLVKQRADLNVTLPILCGTGLRQTYAVDATPKFVILDAHGLVRGTFTGWGREAPGAVEEELNRCLGPEERK